MPTTELDENRDCRLCGSDLSISINPEISEDFGACAECGILYKIELSEIDSNTVVTESELATPVGEYEWNIVSEYYKETGNPAVLAVYTDFDEPEIKNFDNWANENYPSGQWGKHLTK